MRYLLKMTQNKKAAVRFLEEALHMMPNDRAMIAQTLIASLDPEAEPANEVLWQEEIQKRLKDSEKERVEFLSWDSVRRKIKRTYHGKSS